VDRKQALSASRYCSEIANKAQTEQVPLRWTRNSHPFREPKGSLLRMFTRARHWSLYWAIQFTPSHPISLTSTFVFSFHMCLVLPSGLFPSGFPIRTLWIFHIYHACYISRPYHYPWPSFTLTLSRRRLQIMTPHAAQIRRGSLYPPPPTTRFTHSPQPSVRVLIFTKDTKHQTHTKENVKLEFCIF
jgi:hypothetical protein